MSSLIPDAVIETPAVETPAAVVETPVAAAAPARPEGLSDSYWDDATGVKPEAFSRLTELETEAAARAAEIPADGKYVLNAPADLKFPDGTAVAFDAADPLAQAFLTVAAEKKLPQSAVDAIASAYASAQIADAKAGADAFAAEMGKLGTAADARIKAVAAGIQKHAGPKANALLANLTSADAVEAAETLLKGFGAPALGVTPAQVVADPFEGLSGLALLEARHAAKQKAS